MANTKDFIPVQNVNENAIVLGDGSIAMVIQTSAVNFDLLSENEQLAIIGSFAGFLNSLSFSIQILIRSKKLDISHYLNTLKEAEKKQHNPLLQLMMARYRAFVAAIIRDNEVLDKQFYVILAVSPIELGVVKSSDTEKSLQKALTMLNPRRDHILKQLSRIGLKSTQLDSEKLIRLFYDIYNDADKISLSDVQGNPANATAANQSPVSRKEEMIKVQDRNQPLQSLVNPSPVSSQSMGGPPQLQAQPAQQPPPPVAIPVQTPRPAAPQGPMPVAQQPPSRLSSLYSSPQAGNHSPFVVEELPG